MSMIELGELAGARSPRAQLETPAPALHEDDPALLTPDARSDIRSYHHNDGAPMYDDPLLEEQRTKRSSRSSKYEKKTKKKKIDSGRCIQRNVVNRWWLWEFSSCFLAVILFMGIIITLSFHHRRPLSSWSFRITINTLVSTLATLLRVCILFPTTQALGQLKWLWFRRGRSLNDFQTFDNASRGPLGALALVFGARRPHLGLVGAFLIFAGLIIDPFIQEVIQIQSLPTIFSTDATIPLAHTYGSYNFYAQQSQFAAQKSYASNVTAAIYGALFNPDAAVLQVTPSCSTGNCSFTSSYRSLAVCTQCYNITNSIRQGIESNDTRTWMGTGTTFNWTILEEPWRNATRLKINDTLVQDRGRVSYTGEYDVLEDAFINNIVISNNGSGTVSFWNASSEPLLGTISILATDGELGTPNNLTGALPSVWAAECALEICVQTYTATVVHGVLNETVSETISFNNNTKVTAWANSDFTGILPHDCITNGSSRLLPADELPLFPFNGPQVARRASNPEAESTASTVPADCFFDFSNTFKPDISAMMTEEILREVLVGNYTQTDALQNFAEVVSHVAAAMTRIVRQDGNGTAAVGTVYQHQPVIVVYWGWLFLPATLIVLSVFFLIATIQQSGKDHVWKSSALAMVYHGLEDVPYDAEQLCDMEDMAKSQRVILGRDSKSKMRLVPLKV